MKSRRYRMVPRSHGGYALFSWERGSWAGVGGARTLGRLFEMVYLKRPSVGQVVEMEPEPWWDDSLPPGSQPIELKPELEWLNKHMPLVVGRTYTDDEGNIYLRTDRGWVLSEYGPDGPPNVALGPGRKPTDTLN